ncbi:hypothetical protein VCHA38P215_150011 [Vibrio chagasii]|nr:hypothetical protein VCHA38P215_150011 [Vibrio chagasii]
MEAVDGSVTCLALSYHSAYRDRLYSFFYGLATVISVLDSSQIRFLELNNETNST